MKRAQRVRKLMDESGLSRPQLAEAAGMSPDTLHGWAAGRRDPQPESLARLAQGLRAWAARLERLADRLEREAGG